MRVVYSKYSDFSQTEIDAAKKSIVDAQALYDEWYPNVIRWMADKEGWFKRTKQDAWNQIVQNLENAKANYQFLIDSIAQEQEIDITDKVAKEYDPTGENSGEDEKSAINWKLIGLAIGAVVLIIIIFKVL